MAESPEPAEESPEPAPPSTPNAGYVFLCRNVTQAECLNRSVFALPERELTRMQSAITDQTSIFLLNINSGALVGVYSPVGSPGLNLDPEAFNGQFAAQVKVAPVAPPRAVKIDTRLNAGPKTEEEVEKIKQLLNEGESIDPFAIDDDDKGYYNKFPRNKGGKGFKGKGFGKGKWFPMFQKGMFPPMGFGKGKGMEGLWMLAYGNNKGWGKGGGFKVDDSGGILGEFTGTITSFMDNKWYGFIECPEVQAMGHKDVFLDGDQKKGYQVGQKVKFTAFLNKHGKARAKDLKSGLVPEGQDN